MPWKSFSVRAHLALGDVATLGRLDNFDGVFDGDYMVGARFVEVVDNRGQRGGLARADGTGDEDEPVVVREHLLHRIEMLGVTELGQAAQLGGDHAVRAAVPFLWNIRLTR